MDRKLFTEWQAKKFAPVYLFFGKEQFLIKESIHYLRKQLGFAKEDWGSVQIDLEETPIEQVIEEAETAPFLSAQRLIVAHNALFLTGNNVRNKVKHQVEALLSYIEEPVSTSILVLVVPYEQLDRRKKVVKQLEKKVRVIEFQPLKERELMQWIAKKCKKQGVSITPNACEQMLLLIGYDLQSLHQECVKCATYAGSGGVIDDTMVQRLVPRTLEQNVFQLVGKMAERQLDVVLQTWYDLLSQKQEPIRILALIIRQIRLLLQVKLLHEKQIPEREMAKILQSHPYPIKLALRQGRSFSEADLRSLLAQSLHADQKIKTENCDKRLLIEQIFFQLQVS